MPRGRRGFGSAVQALLRYLSAAGSALPAAEGGSEPPRSPLRPGPSPAPASEGLPTVATSLTYAGVHVPSHRDNASDAMQTTPLQVHCEAAGERDMASPAACLAQSLAPVARLLWGLEVTLPGGHASHKVTGHFVIG